MYILDDEIVLLLLIPCSSSSPSSRPSGSDFESTVPSKRYLNISLLDRGFPKPP